MGVGACIPADSLALMSRLVTISTIIVRMLPFMYFSANKGSLQQLFCRVHWCFRTIPFSDLVNVCYGLRSAYLISVLLFSGIC